MSNPESLRIFHPNKELREEILEVENLLSPPLATHSRLLARSIGAVETMNRGHSGRKLEIILAYDHSGQIIPKLDKRYTTEGD